MLSEAFAPGWSKIAPPENPALLYASVFDVTSTAPFASTIPPNGVMLSKNWLPTIWAPLPARSSNGEQSRDPS